MHSRLYWPDWHHRSHSTLFTRPVSEYRVVGGADTTRYSDAQRVRPERTPAASSAVSFATAPAPVPMSGASSRQRTRAEPTITPSAYAATSAACSPLLTP